ncbi:cyclic pyranopterin monophosphate synthase MoaC [Helicobacter sp. MIT 14-3879]|uniref:cyclic pyranopterin monophosphate synthase MoaC n=1 Tax=Helicobacter sp. MIT 14-3879 TaxID=2040649 RepID=UPI000E1FB008|nr:cyclic pyranopterin monophosphate synthase MoaC [Helicobacter sp. MIT 14-3879]RDU64770.1 cyclic pyranopterin monophosphate synthase MoaC [Helicobacter sp. MIT 14-3879]
MKLTHINKDNNPTMVDVSTKDITTREAVASGEINMNKEAYEAFKNNTSKKGSVIDTAVIAAIMGAKKTSDFIPMCHPIFLSKVDCEIKNDDEKLKVILIVKVKSEGKTGVEMEALSGVSIGLLTIYDMLKALDKTMLITNIALLSKSGGKSGDFKR